LISGHHHPLTKPLFVSVSFHAPEVSSILSKIIFARDVLDLNLALGSVSSKINNGRVVPEFDQTKVGCICGSAASSRGPSHPGCDGDGECSFVSHGQYLHSVDLPFIRDLVWQMHSPISNRVTGAGYEHHDAHDHAVSYYTLPSLRGLISPMRAFSFARRIGTAALRTRGLSHEYSDVDGGGGFQNVILVQDGSCFRDSFASVEGLGAGR
jgi:hypothetical protein